MARNWPETTDPNPGAAWLTIDNCYKDTIRGDRHAAVVKTVLEVWGVEVVGGEVVGGVVVLGVDVSSIGGGVVISGVA